MIDKSQFVEIAPKAGLGLGGSLTAMTINDWVGLLVGLATLVYMILQIEKAIRERNKDRADK